MHKLLFKLKIKLFCLLSIAYVIVGVIGGFIFGLLIPEEYFGLFPVIGVFYWVLGLILVVSLDRCRKTNPDKLMNTFMPNKTIKFVLTLLFLILYTNFYPEVKMQFAISLVCNFFIFSFLEMYIYFLYNKKITQKKNRHEIHKQ